VRGLGGSVSRRQDVAHTTGGSGSRFASRGCRAPLLAGKQEVPESLVNPDRAGDLQDPREEVAEVIDVSDRQQDDGGIGPQHVDRHLADVDRRQQRLFLVRRETTGAVLDRRRSVHTRERDVQPIKRRSQRFDVGTDSP
jgi:hypothetical protein